MITVGPLDVIIPSGTVTAGGDPVSGAIVYVFKASDSSYAGNAVTAGDGTYTISLPDGSYKLWIQTNTPGYPDQAYGGDGTYEHATPVDTNRGQPDRGRRPGRDPLATLS